MDVEEVALMAEMKARAALQEFFHWNREIWTKEPALLTVRDAKGNVVKMKSVQPLVGLVEMPATSLPFNYGEMKKAMADLRMTEGVSVSVMFYYHPNKGSRSEFYGVIRNVN